MRDLVPDTNYGDWTSLFCGYSTLLTSWSYIEFVELDDPLYLGGTLEYAVLYLRVFDGEGSGNFHIGAAASPWNEDSITWANRPEVGGIVPPIVASYPPGSGWASYNVTPLVQAWLDGSIAHNGFVLYETESVHHWFRWYSSEADTTMGPMLKFKYVPQGLTTSTWGEIKSALHVMGSQQENGRTPDS